MCHGPEISVSDTDTIVIIPPEVIRSAPETRKGVHANAVIVVQKCIDSTECTERPALLIRLDHIIPVVACRREGFRSIRECVYL